MPVFRAMIVSLLLAASAIAGDEEYKLGRIRCATRVCRGAR